MTYSLNLSEIAANFGNDGNIVGFANKFFTLWSYQITENQITHELTFDAYFIKNLGTKNRFEGVYPFDSGLKGTEIHFTSDKTGTGLELTKQEIKALKFSKNPCRGAVIADSNDLSLLIWKSNNRVVNVEMDPARIKAELANIANRAIELGAVQFNDRLYTPEQADANLFSCKPEYKTRIDWCNDCDLLCWKYNRKAIDNREYVRPLEIQKQELENIKNRAIELGAVEFSDKLYSPKAQSEDWFKEMVAASEQIKIGEAIIVTPKFNIHVDGTLRENGITFQFNYKFCPATYYGPEHSYPIDNKGKAKMIKGKTISINRYEKQEDGIYKVIDWTFVKTK